MASLAEARTHNVDSSAFLQHHQAIVEATREKDDAAAALARAKKAAKNGAIDLDAYKFVQKMRDLEPEEQIVRCRHILEYMNFLGMPIGTQLSMLDAPKVEPPAPKAQRQLAVFEAGEAGLRAGRSGEPATSNPFRPGSEEYASWSSKHQQGMEEWATASSMAPDSDSPVADKADATRKAGEGRRKPGGRKAANALANLDNAREHLNGGATAH